MDLAVYHADIAWHLHIHELLHGHAFAFEICLAAGSVGSRGRSHSGHVFNNCPVCKAVSGIISDRLDQKYVFMAATALIGLSLIGYGISAVLPRWSFSALSMRSHFRSTVPSTLPWWRRQSREKGWGKASGTLASDTS